MSYSISHIATVIGAEIHLHSDNLISHLLFDSRKLPTTEGALFFAIHGERRDGHRYLPDLYERGVRNFVVSQPVDRALFPTANFLVVKDTLVALQQLGAHHRRQFNIPVIGITGSNGKTIVKEWLYQLLQDRFHIVRSPKSYNSQIGVPLSIWQINESHTLGIFEAGISRPGEMEKLAKIIQPTIGILTNIGEAHSEGFNSMEEKAAEKKILLANASVPPDLTITEIKKTGGRTTIIATDSITNTSSSIDIPFIDDASIQNAITCWRVMLFFKYEPEVIKQRMNELVPVNMRLELKKGINHCIIINDSYSVDLSSLEIAMNFLDQQTLTLKKTVILSDFLQSSMDDAVIYSNVVQTVQKHKVHRLIGIGERISAYLNDPKNMPAGIDVRTYPATQDFISQFRFSDFKEETILIKGARIFAFEQIVSVLEQKVHQTVLEINLNAIVHNLREYQKHLKPTTKVMAMVKAFSYGSGGAEIAGILQYHKVDYLGVAYADEGVELRRAGINLPVMVMNPDQNAFDQITENNLQPEIYSFDLLHAFQNYLLQEGVTGYPIHIEIETGMNRLGFMSHEIEELISVLRSSSIFKVESVFTHLAASEDAREDEFTKRQAELFKSAADKMQHELKYDFLRHVANSAAIIRHPEMQWDMVRLGIGMYGVDSAQSGKLKLQTVATLRSTISQIKKLKKGESISYNRKAVLDRDSIIGTVRMGYADGYPRRLGNGAGIVWLNGYFAPVIGVVCMDMFMIDLTDISHVQTGDDVIIFGNEVSIVDLAQRAGTIPYEIMTGISQRVKRVYFEE